MRRFQKAATMADEKFFYRYEEGEFKEGDVIPPRDHINSMPKGQRNVEDFFRKHPEGAKRSSGVFVYKELEHTKKQWLLQAGRRDRYLYKVRVKKIIFEGDVTLFNECQGATFSEEQKAERRDKYFTNGRSDKPQMEYAAEGVEVVEVLGTPETQRKERREQILAERRARYADDEYHNNLKIDDE
jgi:hypothetical protein